jgi:hypothetical protein
VKKHVGSVVKILKPGLIPLLRRVLCSEERRTGGVGGLIIVIADRSIGSSGMRAGVTLREYRRGSGACARALALGACIAKFALRKHFMFSSNSGYLLLHLLRVPTCCCHAAAVTPLTWIEMAFVCPSRAHATTRNLTFNV